MPTSPPGATGQPSNIPKIEKKHFIENGGR